MKPVSYPQTRRTIRPDLGRIRFGLCPTRYRAYGPIPRATEYQFPSFTRKRIITTKAAPMPRGRSTRIPMTKRILTARDAPRVVQVEVASRRRLSRHFVEQPLDQPGRGAGVRHIRGVGGIRSICFNRFRLYRVPRERRRLPGPGIRRRYRRWCARLFAPGTRFIDPQLGHLPRRPAWRSGTTSFSLHVPQAKRIIAGQFTTDARRNESSRGDRGDRAIRVTDSADSIGLCGGARLDSSDSRRAVRRVHGSSPRANPAPPTAAGRPAHPG